MTAECPICYDRFSSDMKLASLRCGHVCCAECLDTWLGNSEEYTCPICRYNPETDQDDDVLDLSGCRPVYLKFGEGSSSASSSPVRRPARPSTASLPGLMRKMDGARHRINGLVIQDAFPVAAELRPAVHGIQGLVDEVRRDLQSAEVQELGRHLLQGMTELTSFLHAQHSLNRSELEAERTARTRLKDQLKSASSRQRKAEEKVLEQSLQLSRLLKQIDDSARETHESRRKAAEHYERAVQRLERENLDLRRKEEESGKRVMEMMNADVSMKSTITNLKKQLQNQKEKGSSGLQQRQVQDQQDEIARLREDNAELQRKLTKAKSASSLLLPSAPAAPLTANNLATHTTRQAVIEDTIHDDSELLIIESSPKPPPERRAAPVQPLLLDRSMFEPDNVSRMPPNGLGQGHNRMPAKRKAEDDPLAFLRNSKSLATGPIRSRRVT